MTDNDSKSSAERASEDRTSKEEQHLAFGLKLLAAKHPGREYKLEDDKEMALALVKRAEFEEVDRERLIKENAELEWKIFWLKVRYYTIILETIFLLLLYLIVVPVRLVVECLRFVLRYC